ncbi:MAG: bifunctional 4-hydroxy-2-oxoglutarate aldolase/2-dehydro-3-deoxy-phosphogluconate aldolase [Leptolinea sp.]|jgi:2-dehydro-3-deoxyphosphogluconate aldolase/(4S)-4-hydroxy-2-oxoglutarate aldolase|nr:bifunctional 4-hydroxy-2-oxoglutarate aldolase/2-dehydro-3-deoxy-phosphogluconate aldolase [Leptolinea sp.]
MDKQTVLSKIKELGLVSVIRGPSAELTVKMVEALVEGGVRGIEITYSTPNAEDVVSQLARYFGESIVLGMGTLTRPAQVKSALAAGANFLVSPVCEPLLVKAMTSSGAASMIGALTPTEVFFAFESGADVVKVFPGSLTGPSYIKALHGPFPQIPMMPTGGVSVDNVKDWFAAGVVAVGAGSELCPPKLAQEGNFKEITTRAKNFVQAVRDARVAS